MRGDMNVMLAHPGLVGQAGREVVLGVRPEDMRISSAGELHAVVELVSPQGAEQFVNARVGDVELMLRLDNHQKIAPGDMLPLTVDPSLLHVFDKSTGESLAVAQAVQGDGSVTPFPPRAHQR
jgi:ABC-type sugar transport system ATPase subunit